MKTKLNLFITAISLFTLVSCSSNKKEQPAPNDNTDDVGAPINGVNVYATGFVMSSTDTNILNAAIWKNGVLSKLSTYPSSANGIARKGTDIYVAGRYRITNNKACYWKNGSLVPLESPSEIIYSQASDIVFQGNDMYVIGRAYTSAVDYTAVYWKNGVYTKLPFPGTYTGSDVSSIAVAGNDVFISGITYDKRGFPCYWKNGVYNAFTTNVNNFMLSAIAVNNNDIYTTGYTCCFFSGPESLSESRAYFFKNNNRFELTGDTQAATAMAITFMGNDQYIVGSTLKQFNVSKAGYWKNGIFIGPVAEISNASCIATDGADVYIGGMYSTLSTMQGYNYFRAAYWKNGIITKLSPTWPSGIGDIIIFKE